MLLLTCRRCGRANPAEALYCHHDGLSLDSSGHRAPLEVGREPFLSPFVFPSGRACRNFDELALAGDQLWDEAGRLLRGGEIERFLGAMGRADLAQKCREAGRMPDHDQGLDRFLASLPAGTLPAPGLAIEPGVEIDLGSRPPGKDCQFELRLRNSGSRLVCGTATVDVPWLSLGVTNGPVSVQFRESRSLVVRLPGRALSAVDRPQQGRITFVIGSNIQVVTVRLLVPVEPFPEGALAGSRSPRQLAERCMANRRAAAKIFETGEVEGWYQRNGWSYPVTIPPVSGLAALQQYFEALGLTKPPAVSLSESILAIQATARPANSCGIRIPAWSSMRSSTATSRLTRSACDSCSTPTSAATTVCRS